MATGKTERVEARSQAYGDEVLCAGWTLTPRLALETLERSTADGSPSADIGDIEAFLGRVYASQQA